MRYRWNSDSRSERIMAAFEEFIKELWEDFSLSGIIIWLAIMYMFAVAATGGR